MKWKKILFIIGTVSILIGAVDPLEGSVVIMAGSILIFVSAQLSKDHYRKNFLIAMIMIAAGVFLLFLFSWMGGFRGDDSILPWWMISLLILYPLGWILTLAVLIVRAVKKKQILKLFFEKFRIFNQTTESLNDLRVIVSRGNSLVYGKTDIHHILNGDPPRPVGLHRDLIRLLLN